MEQGPLGRFERGFQCPQCTGVDPFRILSHVRSERSSFVGGEGNLQHTLLERHPHTASAREVIEVRGVHVSRGESESARLRGWLSD